MKEVRVFDNFVPLAKEYAAVGAASNFLSYHFEHCVFHGIHQMPADGYIPSLIRQRYPNAEPTLSFFRRSPAGQVEPHYIHTDIDMGDWSAILYLNHDAPEGDGTRFWMHKATGEIENPIPHLRSKEGQSTDGWEWRQFVQAKFNRMVIFPSSFYHSRALFENWGDAKEARLTQVTFGKGDIFA